MNHRIIARLDIKGPNLVKGIHLEGLRVLGNPEIFAKHYYETGADELMYIDVVASLYERNSLTEVISRTAKEIFIPLTVGGGLRRLDDIKQVLRAGADKISLNTAAIKNPNIIKEASREFGSSTIVVTIETIKESNGEYLAYIDNGREYTGIEVFKWAKQVEELGAGEIVITSVDREGTGEGYDLDLIKEISEIVSIPVIAHGGAGKKEDIKNAIEIGKADAVAISSILHYEHIKNLEIKEGHATEGNTEFLKKRTNFLKFEVLDINKIKKYLYNSGVNCRHEILGGVSSLKVALIDYEIGNLFSVKNALEKIGIDAEITKNKEVILHADAVILPGVGAFKNAMEHLEKLELISVIKEFINSGKPFMGICLGLQLLFTESEEFGDTEGLDIIKGKVAKFPENYNSKKIKVPQISWNQVKKAGINWNNTELEGIKNGEYLYFIHSYYVIPEDKSIILSKTNYGGIEYCSSIKKDNIFATQFHPEKSGKNGLKIYENFKKMILDYRE